MTMKTNKKNDKKNSDLKQKKNEKIVNRIIIILAFVTIVLFKHGYFPRLWRAAAVTPCGGGDLHCGV